MGHAGGVVGPDNAPAENRPQRQTRLSRLESRLSRSGQKVADLEHRLVPAWRSRTVGEPRWIVSLSVVAAIVLQLALPRKLALPPVWLLPAAGLSLPV